LESYTNPRDKIKCIMVMKSIIKEDILEFYNGQEHQLTMDNELPILIYILIMCHLEDIIS